MNAVDPALDSVRLALGYWRSLVGLAVTTQAEGAETMETTLAELAELLEATAIKDNEIGLANLPLSIYSATGSSALVTGRAMCNQWARSARRFVVDSGVERDLLAGLAPRGRRNPGAQAPEGRLSYSRRGPAQGPSCLSACGLCRG